MPASDARWPRMARFLARRVVAMFDPDVRRCWLRVVRGMMEVV
jgi:hypothetical protein